MRAYQTNYPYALMLSLLIFSMAVSSCRTSRPRLTAHSSNSVEIPFDRDQNASADLSQTLAFYESLAKQYPELSFKAFTDEDLNLRYYEVVISNLNDKSPAAIRNAGHLVLWINNGIHPGEPCGVDATMLFVRDLLVHRKYDKLLDGMSIVIVPFYNVDGALRRGSYSRANQNGPEAYGFRANGLNLDMNRDFSKCDSENSLQFNRRFAAWKPEVFIDTHTSNGADYSYIMTLITTQKDKIAAPLGRFLEEKMVPELYHRMEKSAWPMIPYVNTGGKLEEGIYGFLETPRYSSGYAALHHSLGFLPEAHMLKPFKDRVQSTRVLIEHIAHFSKEQSAAILKNKQAAIRQYAAADSVAISWSLDRSKVDTLLFDGYEAKYKPSAIHGMDRLYYDQAAPYKRKIPFFNSYLPNQKVEIPAYYIIPKAYVEVIRRLKANGIIMTKLEKDQNLEVQRYEIVDFKTSEQPYEGHYLHSQVTVRPRTGMVGFQQGDYLVSTEQPGARYLIEMLEPQATDGFFAWNFFDGILNQKEYFSAYVFEDLAADLLQKNPVLRQRLDEQKMKDPEFAKSPQRQLDFIYKNSPYYEGTVRIYPIGRILKPKPNMQ